MDRGVLSKKSPERPTPPAPSIAEKAVEVEVGSAARAAATEPEKRTRPSASTPNDRKFLRVFQVVGRHDDGFFPPSGRGSPAQARGVTGVEILMRFVEDQHRRIVKAARASETLLCPLDNFGTGGRAPRPNQQLVEVGQPTLKISRRKTIHLPIEPGSSARQPPVERLILR